MAWLIACIVVCSPAQSAVARERRTRTFTSPTYGYSIDTPAAWTAIEAHRELADEEPPATARTGVDILGVHANRRVSKMELPAVVVGAQKVAPGTTIDDWETAVIGTVSFMKGCPAPEARERLVVGGDQAALLTYPNCPEGSGLLRLWLAVIHDGRGFQIVFFDRAGHEARDRALLDRMLASVSFS